MTSYRIPREAHLFLAILMLITSTIILGISAEICDLTLSCGGSRLKFLLVAGLFNALISVFLIVIHAFSIWILIKFEYIFSLVMALIYGCALGVASSPRSASDAGVSIISGLLAGYVGLIAAIFLGGLGLIKSGLRLKKQEEVKVMKGNAEDRNSGGSVEQLDSSNNVSDVQV